MPTNNAVNVALSGSTGSGNFVGANTPTLITPVIGAATGTSISLSGSLTVGTTSGGITVGLSSTTTGLTLNNNTASYSPSTLNYYESKTTTTITASQAVATGTLTFTFSRIGNIVVCSWPDFNFTATATNALRFSDAIPTRFLPISAAYYGYCLTANNSSNLAGTVVVSNSAFIDFHTNGYNNYSNGTICAAYSGTICYQC